MTGDPHGDEHKVHGRRRGRRLRPGRAALLETLLPDLRIDLPAEGGWLDPAALFDPPRGRLWLEIGFGAGEHLAWQAAHNPDVGLIGSEVFVNGVASLLRHMREEGLDNVRIHDDDARALIAALPDASVDRTFLLFPDPWPKARHAPRRFVGPRNLAELARVMADGAELRIASDDVTYQRWALRQMQACPVFAWQVSGPRDWRERTDDWPPTRYEQKAVAAGRRPIYLRYRRRPRAEA
jgi:tRNA (guanine-N7-)-methyltransferase